MTVGAVFTGVTAAVRAPSRSALRYRDMPFGVTHGVLRSVGEVQYLQAEQALGPHAPHMAERLAHWALVAPNRSLFAQRDPDGQWQHITFAQAWLRARSIAQTLIELNLSAERPVAILSENDLNHALLALGCLVAGVPFAPISPAYSLVSQDHEKLKHCLQLLTPGLVFAASGSRYAKALLAAAPSDCTVVVSDPVDADSIAIINIANKGRGCWTMYQFDAFFAQKDTPDVDAALARIDGGTIAKFLFTSGSTKLPKAVVNTHAMWCANQQQMRQSMPILAQEPPVLVDWLPWNHTFGGNHNFGLCVYNGGTLYIDDGKPTPALMGETLRNLRDIAPTAYFNVPTGFEAIANAMKVDDEPGRLLRKTLLSRVKMFFYAGAALGQPVWDSLHESQEAELGERIVMGTGLGMTESSPFGLFVTSANVKSGDLGLPTPGLQLKLVPQDGKLEVRYKGPNITPGYWRMPDVTGESFDEEGFFCTGDAVAWIDDADFHQGLRFDGRIAEDFKLSTGTFVSVGPLRARIIAAGAPFVLDAVITGLNGPQVGAMLVPSPKIATIGGVQSPAALAHLQSTLNALALSATGSSSHVARALWLVEPPQIDRGEITDKGSINQRAVLQHRAALVAALHDGSAPDIVFPMAMAAP